MLVPVAEVKTALVSKPSAFSVPTKDAPELNGVAAEMLLTVAVPVLYV
jgi:hypothetical protein